LAGINQNSFKLIGGKSTLEFVIECLECPKPKNFQITGLKSKQFFLQG